MTDNERIIREFIGAWSRLDVKELVGYFTDDGCYYNIPMEPVRGRDNIEALINGFIAAWTQTDWEILHVAVAGDVVFVERIDKTRSTQGDVDLPCVGVFEMAGGKIREWRDYFDLSTYANAMQG